MHIIQFNTLQIIQSSLMDFDGLDDVLQDNAYVPSFVPRQVKKTEPIKPKTNTFQNQSNKSIKNQSSFTNTNNRSGGLFGLHKQSSKKQPTSFQQFFKQQQVKNASLDKNKSVSNFYTNNQKLDDNDSIFSAQRTNTRRPFSRGRQQQKQPEKSVQKMESQSPIVPRRGMMPPLNKKSQNQNSKKQFDTNSIDLNDNLATTKPIVGKFKDNDLDPLQGLKKQENQQMKKFLQQQIQYQKKAMQKIIQEERQSKKQEIETLKRIHNEQLKKKLQLKDYQIQKMKQFYEMQINLKTHTNTQKRQLSSTNQKIQQSLKQLKKIQTRISQQYSVFHNKQMSSTNNQLQRRQSNLQKRERQLKQFENRLKQMQKQLKQQKTRIYEDQDRQRNRLDELNIKLNQKQSQLQAKYRKKQRQLDEEYDKKRIQLNHQKQKMRYQIIQSQQKKLQLDQQDKQLKRKIKTFQQRQKQMLEELHQQRKKQMQRQIQTSTKLSEITMKQGQVQMQRQQLINKMKILQLQRKKLEIQAKGSLKSVLNVTSSNNNSFDNMYSIGTRNKDLKLNNTTGGFEQYHKTITQMRNQMMSSIPKF